MHLEGTSMTPLRLGQGSLDTNTNETVLRSFPSFFLSSVYISHPCLHFFTHVCRSFGSPLYLRSCFWSSCFISLSLGSHSFDFFCSMRGTQRITDQIVTLVWILSDTMKTTFRRTRRRTYIMMKLNKSSKRRRIRGALEMT